MKSSLTPQQEKEAWQLQIGIGVFVTLLSGFELLLHYVFGVEIEGWTRRLGHFDQTVVWVFFVIGLIWFFSSLFSYIRKYSTRK
ncbi:hypothetical protein IPG41_03445 [Candidatus Peregrinibacteria bacterium]|nr:MAG: hypothetical protein IPG41_03445 [Candidatus Peregrinibacteria bacterium]